MKKLILISLLIVPCTVYSQLSRKAQSVIKELSFDTVSYSIDGNKINTVRLSDKSKVLLNKNNNETDLGNLLKYISGIEKDLDETKDNVVNHNVNTRFRKIEVTIGIAKGITNFPQYEYYQKENTFYKQRLDEWKTMEYKTRTTAPSQKNVFIATDFNVLRSFSDSIVHYAKRNFSFSRIVNTKNYPNSYFFVYVDKAAQTRDTIRFAVEYFKMMIGENKAMEITGTPKYEFWSAMGKFMDLITFWKKYINPDVIIEKASINGDKKEMAIDGKVRIFRLIKDDENYWTIRMN